MINERDGIMEDKKGISPVLIGFIILVLGAVVFMVVKGIGFGIDFYNKYWIENNRSYAKDAEFFDVKHFDPREHKAEDELKDSAVKILYAHINGKTLKECGTKIDISEELFAMTDPDQGDSTDAREWKDLCAFSVVQMDDKAIIVYDYTMVPTSLKEATSYCYDTYKTIDRSRIYLHKQNGTWVASEVYVAQQ